MAKIGRNSACPCGSGKKYKRCCENREAQIRQGEFPSGRFRYEPGSYGGPDRGYMPSILCYKQQGTDSWFEYFCLVKPDAVLESESEAVAIAEKNLKAAHELLGRGGSTQDFALSLRHEGYKSVSDFHIVGNNAKD